MKKTERLFHVIEQLRAARRPITAYRLAGELGVSERTIYRDVKLLIAQGLPIMGEAGVGYVLAPGFNAPPLQFTHDELDVLSIGLRIAFREGDTPMRKAAENAFSKIRAGMKDSIDFDAIDLYAPSGPSAAPSSLLTQARLAIRNKSVITISYLSLSGEATQRALKPIALLFFREATLLSGYCELRQDFRNFRLDRIESFNDTGARFTTEHYRLRRAYFAMIRKEKQAYRSQVLKGERLASPRPEV